MTSSAGLPKALVIFGIVLPLAVLVGYLMATPKEFTSIATVALVFGVMSIPIFLKWHQPILVFSWNAAISLSFLPGKPYLWVPVAMISFFLTVLTSILNKEVKLQHSKSVTWTLLALGAVVYVTAKLTGGLGVRALGGSSFGGGKYFQIFFAIMGYFALSAQRIPSSKAAFYGGLFTLSGVTSAMSNLIYFVPAMWFLYYLIPVDFAMSQAFEDYAMGAERFSRLGGVAWAAMAGYFYMLMRFGLRGILDFSRPWRALLTACLIVLTGVGGYRTLMILCVLCFAGQYFLEGLLRSRLTIVLLLAAIMVGGLLVPVVRHLPIPVQRSLSVLPYDVDPTVRLDAMNSTQWRLKMWKLLLPEIPKYFFLGKGFTASAQDYFIGHESVRRGLATDYEGIMISGDYHSGPLSLILPFGIWGLLAFAGFNIAAFRVLYLNYQHGDPALQRLNTFLLSCFLARLFIFYFIYGAIHSDLVTLVGLVGLSVSFNGGVQKSSFLERRPAMAAEAA